MNEAIKLAIEKGGYKHEFNDKPWDYFCSASYGDNPGQDHIVLDPLFWKALGKALGWDKFPEWIKKPNSRKVWLFHARQYLDLVLTGSDTESFWEELLN